MKHSFTGTTIGLLCFTFAAGAAQERRPVRPATPAPAEIIQAKLDTVADLDFDNLPLEDVVQRLSDRFRFRVVLHASLPPLLKKRVAALAGGPVSFPPIGFNITGGGGTPQAAAPDLDSEEQTKIPPGFSCHLHQLKLGAALDIFLTHYGLDSVIIGDSLVIAVTRKARELARRQPVRFRFEKVPLAKALEEVAKQTGVTVTLDEGARASAKDVSTNLNSVALDKALAILAALVDLRAVAVDKTWVITSNTRAAALEEKLLLPPDTDVDDLTKWKQPICPASHRGRLRRQAAGRCPGRPLRAHRHQHHPRRPCRRQGTHAGHGPFPAGDQPRQRGATRPRIYQTATDKWRRHCRSCLRQSSQSRTAAVNADGDYGPIRTDG